MKKIFALLVCTIMLLCAFPISVFAESESVESIETTVEVVETSPTTEVVETSPTAEETAPQGEIPSEKPMPDITTEAIVGYIQAHFEEISVIVTMILTVIYNIRKHKLLNRSIATTNSNAIAVAENCDRTVMEALERMQVISADVYGYKESFAKLLEEYRVSEEEKKKLEQTLNEAMTYIKASELANVEFANELAELLVLANIPNSKKDELYSRHIAAVKAIEEAEKTEVIKDDGGEET